jgi:hypothetical protein
MILVAVLVGGRTRPAATSAGLCIPFIAFIMYAIASPASRLFGLGVLAVVIPHIPYCGRTSSAGLCILFWPPSTGSGGAPTSAGLFLVGPVILIAVVVLVGLGLGLAPAPAAGLVAISCGFAAARFLGHLGSCHAIIVFGSFGSMVHGFRIDREPAINLHLGRYDFLVEPRVEIGGRKELDDRHDFGNVFFQPMRDLAGELRQHPPATDARRLVDQRLALVRSIDDTNFDDDLLSPDGRLTALRLLQLGQVFEIARLGNRHDHFGRFTVHRLGERAILGIECNPAVAQRARIDCEHVAGLDEDILGAEGPFTIIAKLQNWRAFEIGDVRERGVNAGGVFPL